LLAGREKGGEEDERGSNPVVVRATRAPAVPTRSTGAAEADHRGERARAARGQAIEDQHPGECTTLKLRIETWMLRIETRMPRNEPGKKKPGRSRAFSLLETRA